MDVDADKIALENEKRTIEAYLDHPISREIYKDNAEEQEQIIELLCNRTITNAATFFGHFEAIGHLRGLRRGRAIINGKLEEIETQLKNLQT